MDKIPISEFKANCLAILERVRKTGRPLLVTHFGETVAEIVPPSPAPYREGWLGCMKGTGEILGDIVAPAGDSGEWGARGI